MSFSEVLTDSFRLHQFLTFLNPYFFGNPAIAQYWGELKLNAGIFWESNVYFGILPLLLAGYTVWKGRENNPLVNFYLILLVFCLFFIMNKYNPIFTVAWWLVPGLKAFRFWNRFALPLILFLSVFAGLGLDAVRIKLNQSGKKSKLFRVSFPAIVVFITVIDLFFFGLLYVGAAPADFFQPTQSVEFLKKDDDIFKVYSHDWQRSWSSAYRLSEGWRSNFSLYSEYQELLQPNMNLFYGVAQWEDRSWQEGGQLDKRMSNLLRVSKGKIEIFEDRTIFPLNFLKILGMGNVKYVLSFNTVNGPGLKLATEIKQNSPQP